MNAKSSIPTTSGIVSRVVDVKINKVELKKTKLLKPPNLSILNGLKIVPDHYFYFNKSKRIICCSYDTIRLISHPELEELDGTNKWIVEL